MKAFESKREFQKEFTIKKNLRCPECKGCLVAKENCTSQSECDSCQKIYCLECQSLLENESLLNHKCSKQPPVLDELEVSIIVQELENLIISHY